MDKKLMETLFDISYMIGYRAAGGQYLADDSREAFQIALKWAREFEDSFTDEMNENGEYLERIEEFVDRKLAEQE